jgi:hypothetical protein
LLGAAVQYLFTQSAERKKQYQELRTRAYVDFPKSSAGIAMAQKSENAEKEFEFRILMTDAKARIGIYGSKTVVGTTAEFFRKHGALTSAPALSSYLQVVTAMRADAPGGEASISKADFGQLLFSANVE